MCGLIGYIGKPVGLAEDKTLRDLLRESTIRGTDGWGFMAYRPDGPNKGAYVYKVEGDAGKADPHELDIMDCTAVLMHTRQATSGTKLPIDCHPQVEKQVIVIHNGHVTNHMELRREFSIPSDAPAVDSYLIPWLIAQEKDVMQGIESVFRHCSGSITMLVFTPASPYTIWAASNNAQNLYQFRMNGRDYIASTKDIFHAAIGRFDKVGVSYPAFKESWSLHGVYEVSPYRINKVLDDKVLKEWGEAHWRKSWVADRPPIVSRTGPGVVRLNIGDTGTASRQTTLIIPGRTCTLGTDEEVWAEEVTAIEREIQKLRDQSSIAKRAGQGTATQPSTEDVKSEMRLIANTLKKAGDHVGKRRRKRWLRRYKKLGKVLTNLAGYGADADEREYYKLPSDTKSTCAFCPNPAQFIIFMTDVCEEHLTSFFA